MPCSSCWREQSNPDKLGWLRNSIRRHGLPGLVSGQTTLLCQPWSDAAQYGGYFWLSVQALPWSTSLPLSWTLQSRQLRRCWTHWCLHAQWHDEVRATIHSQWRGTAVADPGPVGSTYNHHGPSRLQAAGEEEGASQGRGSGGEPVESVLIYG